MNLRQVGGALKAAKRLANVPPEVRGIIEAAGRDGELRAAYLSIAVGLSTLRGRGDDERAQLAACKALVGAVEVFGVGVASLAQLMGDAE